MEDGDEEVQTGDQNTKKTRSRTITVCMAVMVIACSVVVGILLGVKPKQSAAPIPNNGDENILVQREQLLRSILTPISGPGGDQVFE